jgi:hypothetical protein
MFFKVLTILAVFTSKRNLFPTGAILFAYTYFLTLVQLCLIKNVPAMSLHGSLKEKSIIFIFIFFTHQDFFLMSTEALIFFFVFRNICSCKD